MIEFQNLAGFAAGFLSVICVVPYIVGTIKGKTKPHRVTWWVLTIMSLIFTANHFSIGGDSTIWLPLCTAIGQLSVAVLSIRYGVGGWRFLDRICIVGIGISLIAWQVFQSPLLSLGFCLAADLIAYLPTMRKAVRAPETENLTCWALISFGGALNLFAIERWDSTEIILPIYLFLTTTTVVGLLLIPYFNILSAKTMVRQGAPAATTRRASAQQLVFRKPTT